MYEINVLEFCFAIIFIQNIIAMNLNQFYCNNIFIVVNILQLFVTL
jgi:hypothetical protein